MSVKLRAPDGMGSVSHGGIEYGVNDDRSIVVPHQGVADALSPHGVRPWNDGGQAVSVAAMTRSQLIAEVMKRTLDAIESMGTEVIRERLIATKPEDIRLPAEHESPGVDVDLSKVTVDGIEKMSRPEMFALLKAKGVAVAPPVTNEQLRAFARDAIAAK